MAYIVKSSLDKEKTVMDNSKLEKLIEEKEKYIKELETKNKEKDKEIEELKKNRNRK